MKEQVAEVMNGSQAYSVVMENLESTWNFPRELQASYPKKYFHHSEDGRGLVLPHNLVYVSSSATEEIRLVDGPIEINSELFLTEPKFKSVGGQIPEKAMKDVIRFTEEVKVKMIVLRNQIPQR